MTMRVKIRRLPDTDIARCSVLDPVARRKELRAIAKPKKVLWTYDPVRGVVPDIYAYSSEIFPEAPRTSLNQVEQLVSSGCKSAAALAQNLPVARALHRFSEQLGIVSRPEHFGGFAVGLGHSVRFWENCVFIIGGEPVIAFHDFRRGHGLNRMARRLVATLQHEQIRKQNPKLVSAKLATFHCAADGTARKIVPLYIEDSEILDGTVVAKQIAETLEDWKSVLEEQARTDRSSFAAGDLFRDAG